MDFDKSPVIDIRLLESDIHLHGSQGNGVLRGSVTITVQKSHTLQSLELLFEGFQYLLSDHLKRERKQIAHHPVTLYPVTSSTATDLLLSPGTTQCSFETLLPQHLPATIHCPELHIQYTLRANMCYSRVSKKRRQRQIRSIVCSVPVRLVQPIASMSMLCHGVDSLKQTTPWCQYRVLLEQRSVTAGQRFWILLQLAPHLENMRVEQVYLEWIERRRVATQKTSKHLVLPIRWLRLNDTQQHVTANLPVSLDGIPCAFRLQYQVPEHLVPSTHYHDQFAMDHSVIVSMLLSFPVLVKIKHHGCAKHYLRRYTKTVRFETDMQVVDGDEDACLPAYQECCRRSVGARIPNTTLIMQDSPPAYTP